MEEMIKAVVSIAFALAVFGNADAMKQTIKQKGSLCESLLQSGDILQNINPEQSEAKRVSDSFKYRNDFFSWLSDKSHVAENSANTACYWSKMVQLASSITFYESAVNSKKSDSEIKFKFGKVLMWAYACSKNKNPLSEKDKKEITLGREVALMYLDHNPLTNVEGRFSAVGSTSETTKNGEITKACREFYTELASKPTSNMGDPFTICKNIKKEDFDKSTLKIFLDRTNTHPTDLLKKILMK